MQRVFITFKEVIRSFPLGEMNLGTLRPARYNGFRNIETIAGLELAITHDDPKTIKKKTQTEYTTFGAIVTPNGSYVHETEPIPVSLDSNFGNNYTRRDILVCEHEYVNITGGQPAIYLVIKGDEEGNIPQVPNPQKQVRVGVFTLEPQAFNINGINWEPDLAPLLGDNTLEELLEALQIPDATIEKKGIIQIATAAEALARESAAKAITPATLAEAKATTAKAGTAKIATENQAEEGTNDEVIITPLKLNQQRGKKNLITVNAPSGDIEINVDPSWDGKNILVTQAGIPSANNLTLILTDNLKRGMTFKIINTKILNNLKLKWEGGSSLKFINREGTTISLKMGIIEVIITTTPPEVIPIVYSAWVTSSMIVED